MNRITAAVLCLVLLWPMTKPGAAVVEPLGLEPLDQAVCRLIEPAAHANRLPVGFMTRLIWRESSFRAHVVSPAGAQGIAQFMPGTATERRLTDPFDPEQAIPKAAHLLADLYRQFGNLGVAAAAYNAGPARVASWLRGQAELPAETRAYVRFVTERAAESWAKPTAVAEHDNAITLPPEETCLAVTTELRRSRGGESDDDVASGPLAPWGVQLAGNFSKTVALASFERARARYARVVGEARPMIIGRLLRGRGTRRFYQVRLPAESRQAAESLCGRIRSVGGVCVALRS